MQIWVDADACPGVIKHMLFRAAVRCQILTTFVANHALNCPPSPFIRMQQVDKGFDVADHVIVAALSAGDLVITADIPLAAAVVAKGAWALNPRGEMYSTSNIQERLAMRDLMACLRDNGVPIGGPSAMHASDQRAFAAQLDQFLARHR